ncbi:TIGR03943 family putative permease subunit [Streptomyces caniscabiei]|uniref:TIGR03943 family protein n=1 Tax=Streptomyces caniscabiei TaxID=2746961 RepID=A0A927L4A6_9ACTN|nr:TIGR03943 family protein [Streptomyces caniscabiei]MBD9703340.1 TIGR03943 family protein [Streptomyces caniscabiei]MBD9725810.1 TIGR03943 family protein [Streptomyces caniscabiei]MDX3507521.1 TIGR03943 family protein [Streptomyces caniscabiei]MDX3717483.1 TIGR03943 family protein [Streptomyces caniscabiei]MDX3726830.1 TIGR03943 family protein [Streptomyces caniscabiei]
MNRQAQTVILFLTGGALLHAGFTDLYLRYVKAGLRPLLIGAGIVLIAAAVATLWYERRARQQERQAEPHAHADDSHAHPDEPHAHREPRVSWLLVLPLLALVLVAPPAAGSYTAMRTGAALQEQPWGYPKLPADGTLRLSVADYAGRAVYDKGRALAGRPLKVTGFLAFDDSGTPYLVRMALNCCAADAQPVKIALTGELPAVLQPDTWIEVTGTYTPKRTEDPLNGTAVPYLRVTTTKPVKAPQDPYDEAWNG